MYAQDVWMSLRLREARTERRVTQQQLAEAIDVPYQTIQKIEAGKVNLSWDRAKKIAKYLNCRIGDLDSELFKEPNQVPILGYVGAGAEVFPFEGDAPIDYMTPVRDVPEGTAGAIVRGTSMLPALRDGDTLFYLPQETISPDLLVGKECVVRTTDGRVFVKQLERGSIPGKWKLVSYNAPEMDNISIDWAARVRWVEKG